MTRGCIVLPSTSYACGAKNETGNFLGDLNLVLVTITISESYSLYYYDC